MALKWIGWSRRLAAIAQDGLTYSNNPFDNERYASVRDIAAEIMAGQSGAEASYVAELLAGETGHATPKVDVRGVIFQADRILLVKEKDDGLWSLPGGWAEVQESPSNAVVREVREESGYVSEAVKLLALYDRGCHEHPPYPFAVYMLFFLCRLIDELPMESEETEEVGFFARNELPELSRNRVTPAQLERLFQLYVSPDSPTVFD
jgi:ADP-ribose pyrophosphatase YjhB (NUDIX family)